MDDIESSPSKSPPYLGFGASIGSSGCGASPGQLITPALVLSSAPSFEVREGICCRQEFGLMEPHFTTQSCGIHWLMDGLLTCRSCRHKLPYKPPCCPLGGEASFGPFTLSPLRIALSCVICHGTGAWANCESV
jgi:hypothetical protein